MANSDRVLRALYQQSFSYPLAPWLLPLSTLSLRTPLTDSPKIARSHNSTSVEATPRRVSRYILLEDLKSRLNAKLRDLWISDAFPARLRRSTFKGGK